MKKFMFVVALVALPFLALAQVVPTPEDPSAFFAFLLQAIQTKQWAVVGIAVTIGLVYVARRFGSKYVPFLATRRGGALLALLGGLAVAFAQPILTGVSLSTAVIVDALVYGVGAAGGWTVIRRIVLGDAVAEPAVVPTLPATIVEG